MIGDMYHGKSRYGSTAVAVQSARKKDKTSTADDVIEFFKTHVNEKDNTRAKDWFRSTCFLGITAGLVFISKVHKTSGFGFILVDMFRSYSTVLPFASKQPGDALAEINETQGLK